MNKLEFLTHPVDESDENDLVFELRTYQDPAKERFYGVLLLKGDLIQFIAANSEEQLNQDVLITMESYAKGDFWPVVLDYRSSDDITV